MATQSTLGYQEEDKDKKQQEQTSGSSLSAQGGPSATPGGIGMGQPAKASSGRFTNIQSYLNANKGAGQQIGQKIGSNIQTQQQQLGQNLSQTSGVKSKIGEEEGRVKSEAQSVREAVQDQNNQRLGGIYQAQGQPTQTQVQSLQDLQNYKLSDAAQRVINAQTQAEQLQSQGSNVLQQAGSNLQNIGALQQALQTEAGRAGLMRQLFGGGAYSQGQRKLDQALFQSSGEALKQAQQQAAQAKLTGSKSIDTESQDLTSRLGQLTSTATAEQQATQEAARKALENFEAQQQGELAGATQKRDESIADIKKQFEEQKFAKDVAQKLGIDSGTILFDLINKAGGRAEKDPFSTYVSGLNTGELNKADVIDANELYRYAALNQLLGKPSAELGYQKVGAINPYTLEADKFKTDLQRRYEERMADAMNANTTGYNVQRYSPGMFESGGSAVGQANINVINALRNSGLNVAASPVTSSLTTYGNTSGADRRSAREQAIGQARQNFQSYLDRLGYLNTASVRDEENKQADLARFLATQAKK